MLLSMSYVKAQDIAVNISGPRAAVSSSAITYRIYVTNNSRIAASNVRISAPAVPNLTISSITCGNGAGNGGSSTCPTTVSIGNLQSSGLVIPNLPSGSVVVLTVNGTAGTAVSNLNYTATAVFPGDSNSVNNTATLTTNIYSANACGASTTYSLNLAQTQTNNTIANNGGTINLYYTRTAGAAIPGLADPLIIPVTYSDLIRDAGTGVDHQWFSLVNETTGSGIGLNLGMASYNNNTPAQIADPGSVYNGLPATNIESSPIPNSPAGNNLVVDGTFTESLRNGRIDQLGTFTLNFGNIPVPSGVRVTSETLVLQGRGSVNGIPSGAEIVSGLFAKPIIQNGIENSTTVSTTPDTEMEFGQTYTWRYTAFATTGFPRQANRRGVVFKSSTITFSASTATPVINTTASTCSAAGTATVGNYAAGNTYTFTPSGPTVGPGGVISGLVYGTSYTVVATAGGCQSNASEAFSIIFNDSDGDGVADECDLDDDNDGILDTAECSNTINDMANAFNTGALQDIVPSDFGLALNVKNQNVTADLSSKFGYPADSGAVIVSISNASVHPTANAWWTKLGQQPSVWKVSGTMSAFVLMAQDVQYYGLDSKTIHIYDTGTVIPIAFPGMVNQTAVSGQWSITDTPSQKTLTNLDNNISTIENANWRFANMNFGTKTFGFSTTTPNADPVYAVLMYLECDSDGDGIPDRLDLDSDGDGCSDAVEGSADIVNTQLVTAGGTVSGGSTAVNQNLCATGACVNTSGIPQISPLPQGYSNTAGQSGGDSKNALVNGCVCYEDPALVTGATYPVKHGITLLGRAGATDGNWPMLRNSAYTALESKTKGFVITRNSSPETTISIPVVGMMVFDTDENAGAGCLKIYTGSAASEGWKCFSTQGCP